MSNLSTFTLKEDGRPPTPPELQKFRRAAHDTGKRYIHPGQIDDIKRLNLENQIFGKMKEDPNSKLTAKDLISLPKASVVEKLHSVKTEAQSKQPRIGKSIPLGTLPPDFDTKMARGISTKASETAKNVIFPVSSEDPHKGEDVYRKSHRTYQPGEQKQRGYEWKVNPNDVRFGVRSEVAAFNGISKGVGDCLGGLSQNQQSILSAKAVEDFRDSGDNLGKTRQRGLITKDLDPNFSFGKPVGKDPVTAAEVIRGNYGNKEKEPDIDLGKSITPGFRNISVDDRVFGCPTIRTDLKRTTKSIADSQAYGDDLGARDLISPAPYSDLMIPEGSFVAGKPQEYLEKLFDNIGYSVPSAVSDLIFKVAANGGDTASIVDYRKVLNDYLIACDDGTDSMWVRSMMREARL